MYFKCIFQFLVVFQSWDFSRIWVLVETYNGFWTFVAGNGWWKVQRSFLSGSSFLAKSPGLACSSDGQDEKRSTETSMRRVVKQDVMSACVCSCAEGDLTNVHWMLAAVKHLIFQPQSFFFIILLRKKFFWNLLLDVTYRDWLTRTPINDCQNNV